VKGRELQKAVIDLAHLHGFKVAHFQSVLATRKDGTASWRTPVAADGKGFPDLFCVKGKRAVAVEIKGDGDTVKPEQLEWHQALSRAGVEVYVWTSKSWREGAVDQILSA